MNFVHGGISLQEMVVPIVEYHYLRNQTRKCQRNKKKYDTKPVTLNLLSVNRKIGNMIFSLNFCQKEAVSDNREAATYLLYFVDSEGNRSVKSLPSISLLLWMSLTSSAKIGRTCYGINNREQKLP